MIKQALKNIFFSFLVITVVFGVIEMAFRVRGAIRSHDASCLLYGGGYFKRLLRSFGRAAELKLAKGFPKDQNSLADSRLIWCFGGSNAVCVKVKPSDSWPAILEKELRACYPSKEIRVMNYAVPGAASQACLEKYRKLLEEKNEKPYAVIFYIGCNDGLGLMAKGREGLTPNIAEIMDARLKEISYAYLCLKELYFLRVKKNINLAHEPGSISYDAFREKLDNIIIESKKHGIILVLALEPLSKRFLDQYYSLAQYEKIGQVMKVSAIGGGVLFFNMMDAAEKDDDFETYYVDGIHVDERGNKACAKYLFEFMRDNNIMGEKKT